MAEPNGWHLKREVSIGHLLTTAAVTITAFMYIGKIETRIALLESRDVELARQIERDTHYRDAIVAEIRAALIRIESKLDGKADKK